MLSQRTIDELERAAIERQSHRDIPVPPSSALRGLLYALGPSLFLWLVIGLLLYTFICAPFWNRP